jgi:hypothetical protein
MPMIRILHKVSLVACLLALTTTGNAQEFDESASEGLDRLVRQVLARGPVVRREALRALAERGKPDVAAALIQALRHVPDDDGAIQATLETLVDADVGGRWHDWMLWQQAHPEIEPFDGFDRFKADVMAVIDPNFRLFLRAGVAHEIRLEEIAWGGVVKDGIPALVDPTHVSPAEADYLQEDELVFGVQINGDARAYPLRILDWHEMFNDRVGGVPLALAYCTLCGSGILYETQVPGRAEPFVFGSSGFLYRSNKLMYDRQTHSLWNQFTGRPVVGPLTGSGIELKVRPVTITSWQSWLERHPDTKVLSLETGYARDYQPGRPYGAYFADPELMFPALVPDARLKPKEYVFALRAGGHEKAWPLSDFAGGKVINDTVGGLDVVLIGDAATRTVRAFDAGGRDFAAAAGDRERVVANGEAWRVEEEALIGPYGDRLARLPGHIAYWFAWSGFRTGLPLYEN